MKIKICIVLLLVFTFTSSTFLTVEDPMKRSITKQPPVEGSNSNSPGDAGNDAVSYNYDKFAGQTSTPSVDSNSNMISPTIISQIPSDFNHYDDRSKQILTPDLRSTGSGDYYDGTKNMKK